ncbi:MAG: exodeoxyribonuclease V subunit gamma, partial [Gordonia sp. (in: high G+C Gram-positive bacteria)]
MLRVHRSERADVLADVLAGQLSTPLADPMVREVVAVPVRGVERWLSQRLALRLGADGADDGVAANIDFLSPEQVLQRVVTATADAPEAAQAWYSDALIWPVLSVLDENLGDSRLEVLAAHLAGAAGSGRRAAAASTVAGLFGGYGWQRPAMLAEWAAGRDTDGAGAQLPEALAWQPWFWRQVRERIGQPHLAEQLADVVERLSADPGAVDLPPRLAFFGPTRVPAALRSVLGALSAERHVSLFVPHPSDAMWQANAVHALPVPRARRVRSPYRPRHRLLAALSRDVRELQEVLAPLGGRTLYHPLPDPAGAPTLLGTVQEGLRRDEMIVDGGLAADDTLEVPACHGVERQVEVLRERLVRLFDEHPDLQPRDVVIMCPDVETFAPLIQAAFDQSGLDGAGGAGGPRHPGSGLRVRLADRGLRETNEVLDVLAVVLDMAADRV